MAERSAFPPAEALGRIRQSVLELGYVNALFYYLAEILRRVGGGKIRLVRYRLVAQPVARTPMIARPDPKTHVRLVDVSDGDVHHFPRPPLVIKRRYDANNLCLQARVGDSFAGFLWLAFGGYDEDEVRCRYILGDPEVMAWDFDVYVEPHFRLGRTFIRLWDAANELLHRRGIAWSLSRISAFNRGSLNSHGRLGLMSLGYATFICCGETQLAFLPGRKLPVFSWNERSRPEVVLGKPS